MDENDYAFFDGDGESIIFDCFRAVLTQNQNDNSIMPTRFRQWVVDSVSELFQWPSNRAFGNAFKYLRDQYLDNVKTNIRTHCKKRLTLFFKMCVYELNDNIRQRNHIEMMFNAQDVTNAVKYTYDHRDITGNDIGAQQRLGVLLDELRHCGAPGDCNIRNFVSDNWFKSLRMWLEIQRHVQNFNLAYANIRNSWYLFRKYPLYVTKPTVLEPPHINNFVVIPMCSFQRRHIRIDTDVLYQLLCAAKNKTEKRTEPLLPRKIGKNGNWINITAAEFRRNPTGSWGLFFDTEKIVSMVRGKKEFDNSILTDGVSVTVCYLRQSRPVSAIPNEEVIRQYEGGKFWYELGIDPGMKTWNSTVRKDIRTGEEVRTFFHLL